MSLYDLARPLLFAQDPERVHELAMEGLARLARSAGLRARATRRYRVAHPALRQRLWGLEFPAPVGLAAGFDKSARAPLAWQALGFGFAEFGTVTPRPQEGNPRPRLWRDARRMALVNRMGFNNDGAAEVAKRLWDARLRAAVPFGVNVGKQRETPLEDAPRDYLDCLEAVAGVADFAVANVSSPNTPGLRELQREGNLRALLDPLAARARALRTPLLLKVDPDLEPKALEALVAVSLDARIAGLVATNTSLELPRPAHAQGGVSGLPLKERSTAVLRQAAALAEGRLPLVGVGGVFTAEDAYQRVRAGASLVEVYTGFVYEGPGCARRIHEGLLALLERDGFGHLSEAVGADLRERAGP